MNSEELYMQRCIELAMLGAGNVAPNPMVGSVLVYEDRIIGEGYHRQYGEAHAEVNCIKDAELKYHKGECNSDEGFAAMLQKSTIYVSLEPCAHYGKTPPCADLIIEKKIPEVVIGCRDPFNLVVGKGIEKLLNAGLTVRYGIMEENCKKLNKRFFTFHTRKRPYIILKWAQSADCKIGKANHERLYITNEVANRVVHKWRSEEASILVGTNTALADNPALTNRLWSGKNPTRLVVDMNLRLPASLQLFDGAVKTIVFNLQRHDEANGTVYYQLKDRLPLAQQVSDALFQLNIQSVLVEGGAKLLQSFIDEGLWDEARIITNEELLIGSGVAAPVLALGHKFANCRVRKIGGMGVRWIVR
jgi:diaminohydroxyphosphoribosylaminopyrimidine deaminase/5-amino-6-(5-phosphoribosylamino)uracil reductase